MTVKSILRKLARSDKVVLVQGVVYSIGDVAEYAKRMLELFEVESAVLKRANVCLKEQLDKEKDIAGDLMIVRRQNELLQEHLFRLLREGEDLACEEHTKLAKILRITEEDLAIRLGASSDD